MKTILIDWKIKCFCVISCSIITEGQVSLLVKGCVFTLYADLCLLLLLLLFLFETSFGNCTTTKCKYYSFKQLLTKYKLSSKCYLILTEVTVEVLMVSVGEEVLYLFRCLSGTVDRCVSQPVSLCPHSPALHPHLWALIQQYWGKPSLILPLRWIVETTAGTWETTETTECFPVPGVGTVVSVFLIKEQICLKFLENNLFFLLVAVDVFMFVQWSPTLRGSLCVGCTWLVSEWMNKLFLKQNCFHLFLFSSLFGSKAEKHTGFHDHTMLHWLLHPQKQGATFSLALWLHC